jgi:hypothetical protein
LYLSCVSFHAQSTLNRFQSWILFHDTLDGGNLLLYGQSVLFCNARLCNFHLSPLFDFLRLVRSEEDDMDTSWEQRLVKRFYDKLLKSILCEWMLFNGLNSIVTPTSEIHFNIPWTLTFWRQCIADMSLYNIGKVCGFPLHKAV